MLHISDIWPTDYSISRRFHYLCYVLLLLFPVLLHAQPVADFSMDKALGCSPLIVRFTNNSSGATSYQWDFGNGNTSSLANPSATFVKPGSYTVTLTAINNSQRATTRKSITVASNPVANFGADKTGGCTNDPICFTDFSTPGSGPITQWSWDFGDGNSSFQKSPPCNRYSFSDSFKVTLVIKDINGCQSTITKNKYISISDPKVQFSEGKPTACSSPLDVSFKDSTLPANKGYTYLWSFGDGHTSNLKNPKNTYSQRGIYSVSLTVTSPNGCARSVTKNNLVVIQQPKADFSANTVSGCLPLLVGFNNLSVAADTSLLNYTWKTNTGIFSTDKNPSFVFTNPGTYNVSLKTSAAGCADSVTKTKYITVSARTSVSVSDTSRKLFCSVPATVSLTALPTGLKNTTWLWGDGTMTTNGNKSYANFGSYSITLIGENASGCKDTLLLPDQVKVSPSGFTMSLSPKNGCKPLQVNMNATDTGLVPLSNWQWSVNGVVFSPTKSTSYVFNDSGIYVVKCTGTNAGRCSFTLQDTVKVGLQTHPKFTADKHLACYSDGSIQFTNYTNDTVPIATNWLWSFSDQGSSVKQDPLHKYADTGTFDVTLTAIMQGCSTAIAYKRLVTILGPKALFNIPAVNCINDTLVFDNISKGGHKWQWNFGDQTISENKNVKHKYTQPGTYRVSLIVWDTITHCMDSMSKTVLIPKPPVLNFSQSDTAGCPSLIVTFTDQSTYDAGSITSFKWSFGDQQSATGKTAQVGFEKKGFFYSLLTLTDKYNCPYSLRKDSSIHVYGGKAAFTVSPDAGCLPLVVSVTDQSVSDFRITSKKWFWGLPDSTVTTQSSATYTYLIIPSNQRAGYVITLYVTDSMGCTYSAWKLVKPTKPAASFSANITKGCGYDSVRLSSDQSSSAGVGPFSFKWILGGNALSDSSVIAGKYVTTDTTYLVKFIIKDVNGCADSVVKPLKLNARKPVAGFLSNPSQILNCPGPPIFFTDATMKGASGVKSWEWDFGDKTKSFLQNPAKTYLVPGVYSVTLKITDSLNCVSTLSLPDYIRILGPVASYSITHKSGCEPLGVSFYAISSNTRKFEWDLGNGIIDTHAVFTYAYPEAGRYIPNLAITDSAGCRRALSSSDTIYVYPLPEPHFTSNKTIICKGNKITFTSQSTHDKPIVKYKWMFTSGDTIVQSNPVPVSETYMRAGTYDVRLRVTDALGCSDSITKEKLIVVFSDTVAPQVPHVYRATVIDNNHVLLEFASNHDSDFAKYTVFYNYAASLQPGASSDMVNLTDTVFTQSQVNTLSNVYSYAVMATDVCLNTSPLSFVNSTIELNASPGANSVSLRWTPYKGWNVNRYTIYRSDTFTGNFQPIATVNENTQFFIDSTTSCFKTFYYKVKANEDKGYLQESWSDTSGAKPVYQNIIPTTQTIRATVSNNKFVVLEWEKRTHRYPFSVAIYRAIDDGASEFYKEVSSEETSFRDDEVNVQEHSYTYITYLKDRCNAVSMPSNPAKTILLKIALQKNENDQYNPELSWSAYTQWVEGIEKYDVEFRYDSLSNFTVIDETSPDKLSYFHRYMHHEQRQYCYRITAYRKNSSVVSTSNISCVQTSPQLYAPTAFTVNGDNLNETFKISGIFITEFHLRIYNRYGEMVFESFDMNDSWDGTFRGRPCPSDVYVFLAEGRGRNGSPVAIKGTVTLLR